MVSDVSFQQARDSISPDSQTFPVFIPIDESLLIYKTERINKLTISGDTLIWGNPSYDIWGTNKWGASIGGTTTTEYVINQNNVFYDNFDTQDFIDSSSTGTYSTGLYSIGDTETYQSEIIAKESFIPTKVRIYVDSDENSNVNYYISGNGGTNWESTTNNTEHTFTYTSSGGVKLKISTYNSGSIWGSVWGSTWRIVGYCDITSVKVSY